MSTYQSNRSFLVNLRSLFLILISVFIFIYEFKVYADSVIGEEVMTSLASHIPHGIHALTDSGRTSGDQEISVTISLALNHEAELNDLIQRLYDPRDPMFNRFLTPLEFHARFSPTVEQVDKVWAALIEHEILPVSINQSRTLIQVRGTVHAFNKLFHTELHLFNNKKGESFYAPAYELRIPEGLSIQGVHGLQNLIRLKKHAIRMNADSSNNASGSGPGGGLSPLDIHHAYNIPLSLTGVGQTLALFELDGYDPSDIEAYEEQFKLNHVSLKNILVGSAPGGSGGAGAPEVTLDIELMIALAPRISEILVYEGTNDEQGILATYAQIANDNQAHQVSTSWGLSEDESTAAMLQSENSIFKQMIVQGQVLYAASGDSGAYDDGTKLSVDDPASQPYVVGVGGTSLNIAPGGYRVSETTWNTNNTPSGGGGGGGFSAFWRMPSWQRHAVTSQTLGSTFRRNVPDVSLNADPRSGYAIYSGGAWNIYGGTSCAAPLWAAFHALVNQYREMKKLNPLGFPNPLLYRIGLGYHYRTDFYDIKDHNTNMHFPAVLGFDDATGWGTLNGRNLLKDLSRL